ncbi:hypothetical protein [Psychrobacter sp. PG1]|uniref:hypothetical protein n=1 Tax=unclassified Psychrobacter TaxID=196806 RepID=UPI0018680B56|nr:hypothetical protein [Psychrobacter sp. PG1]
MLSKKIMSALVALPVLLALSTPSQAALQGDACIAGDYGTKAQYRCSVVGNGQYMSISEIYQLGYRVVSAYAYEKTGNTVLIIEKQS